MNTHQKIVLSLALILSLLTACNKHNTVYIEFRTPEANGWNKDSIYSFPFAISDTAIGYDIMLYLRHTECYPYQNMWLFVSRCDAGQTIPYMRDTLEFYLADDRGQWLGNGRNGLIEMPVIYEQNLHFKDTGTYTLRLQQGMRMDILPGINDIGVEVTKNYGKE
ncbi:MAG: gliding motility lipoprotein GldH [Paludibacteraceae bacterium]|nr:gliding motility lipoprotein GldH [Paludibacteraceae bacterium]